jgi:hypothetical protein
MAYLQIYLTQVDGLLTSKVKVGRQVKYVNLNVP